MADQDVASLVERLLLPLLLSLQEEQRRENLFESGASENKRLSDAIKDSISHIELSVLDRACIVENAYSAARYCFQDVQRERSLIKAEQ